MEKKKKNEGNEVKALKIWFLFPFFVKSIYLFHLIVSETKRGTRVSIFGGFLSKKAEL